MAEQAAKDLARTIQESNQEADRAVERIFDNATQQAQRIHEMTRTPFERAQAEIAELNSLVQDQFITADEYNRRIEQIAESFTEAAEASSEFSAANPALEFGSAAAFSATGPRDIASINTTSDPKTHEHLTKVERLLEELKRAVADNTPVQVGSI
jgi:methyl-accepting chemotaxis protein